MSFGTMSLASIQNAIIPGTLKNDLVLYHANAGNKVVIGIAGSTKSLMVSHSNILINSPLITSSAKYAYGLFNINMNATYDVAFTTNTLSPVKGLLTNQRNGLNLSPDDSSTINVPWPGLYVCTFSYYITPGSDNIVGIVADGNTVSWDYGQVVKSNSSASSSAFDNCPSVDGGRGLTTIMLNANTKLNLVANFLPVDGMTVAIRSVF